MNRIDEIIEKFWEIDFYSLIPENVEDEPHKPLNDWLRSTLEAYGQERFEEGREEGALPHVDEKK